MNYTLNTETKKVSILSSLKTLLPLMKGDGAYLIGAAIAILASSLLNLIAPIIIGQAIDKYIQGRDYHGLIISSIQLLFLYLGVYISSYLQTKLMGGVGQRVLFSLRSAIFNKLQSLPVAFFNQNKTGDLISRINNDTDKLNQFFSQSLMQFIGSGFMVIGAGIFILGLNIRLGAASLLPALFLLIFTQIIGGYVKKANAVNLQAIGSMSAEVQESLTNFRVIVAFNRRDYFRKKFNDSNVLTNKTAVKAGILNTVFMPIYDFAGNIAQLIVVAYGIYLITQGNFTIGLLVGFLAYVSRFYDPLRQMASFWSSLQIALASWDRISAILSMHSNLTVTHEKLKSKSKSLLEFKDVCFQYVEGQEVLHNITLNLQRAKTYALVGPTGGGKTTTASLMARLYDPTSGSIFFDGQDMRSYEPAQLAQKIGFILQEPFLFTGTVRENILYGNTQYANYIDDQLVKIIKNDGLENLLGRFEEGLDTKILNSGDTISIGQRQLIAFMRAMLRHPELLILDEATANIDTVTEKLLEEILDNLPKETTRVIIAHRLNTIANADEIYFVNDGNVTQAGSLKQAVDMLLHGKRQS